MSAPGFTKTFNTAATEWVVEHNLGKSVISDVFVFDGSNRPVKVLPLDLIEESDNIVRVVFSQPQRGLVRVI